MPPGDIHGSRLRRGRAAGHGGGPGVLEEPRAPLPSESYLQHQYGVSRGTVRAAVGILRDEGLVVTIGGRGTFVRPAAAQAGQ